MTKVKGRDVWSFEVLHRVFKEFKTKTQIDVEMDQGPPWYELGSAPGCHTEVIVCSCS